MIAMMMVHTVQLSFVSPGMQQALTTKRKEALVVEGALICISMPSLIFLRSNGATMRFKPECDFAANAGLGIARQVLEQVKAKHPGILFFSYFQSHECFDIGVSYADLWTLAGVVAIEYMGGPSIPWRPGKFKILFTTSI